MPTRNIQVSLSEEEFNAELSYTNADDGVHVALGGRSRIVGMTPTLEDVIAVVHDLGDDMRARSIDRLATTLQEAGEIETAGLSLSDVLQIVSTVGVDPAKVRIVGSGIVVDG